MLDNWIAGDASVPPIFTTPVVFKVPETATLPDEIVPCVAKLPEAPSTMSLPEAKVAVPGAVKEPLVKKLPFLSKL